MKCQGEGCEKAAVTHITEISEGEPGEYHLCGRHTDEYFGGEGSFREQLRRASAAGTSGREPGLSAEAVRSMVQLALRVLGGLPASEAVRGLVELLRDPAPNVRWIAAVALARLGRGSTEAIAVLRDSLQDADAEVRDAAAWALRRLETAAGGEQGG